MERGKLEEYKDAPGVALLNAFNNGHLTRAEYQVIQKFKKEPWDDIDEFLKNVDEEGTKTVESTKKPPIIDLTDLSINLSLDNIVPKFRPMRSVFQYCEIMGQIQ